MAKFDYLGKEVEMAATFMMSPILSNFLSFITAWAVFAIVTVLESIDYSLKVTPCFSKCRVFECKGFIAHNLQTYCSTLGHPDL